MSAELLRKAKALIDSPEKWFSGSLKGNSNKLCASMATRIALFGDVELTGGQFQVWGALNKRVWGSHGSDLVIFNDTHTHAEVMELFDKAIALEEERELNKQVAF